MKNQKIISLILALTFIFGCINIPIFAENEMVSTNDEIIIPQSGVIGENGYKGSSYLNAVDGDYSTYYDGLQGQYIEVDLGNVHRIEGVGYVARTNTSNMLERMNGCYFAGSNDGENWTTIFTITNGVWGEDNGLVKVDKTQFSTQDNSYRYIKFQAPEDQYCNVAEIKLYGTSITQEDIIDISDSTITGGTSYKNQNPYSNAVDGDLTTYYDGLAGQYIMIDFGKQYAINGIGYMARSNSSDMLGRMNGCYFAGSNDGESWTTFYTIENPRWIDNDVVKIDGTEFVSNIDTKYQYIKFQAPKDQYCNVMEIKLFGIEVSEQQTTSSPTLEPTATPTSSPTLEPTATPTSSPTLEPMATPTSSPTLEPTATPTLSPTLEPTVTPISSPTLEPNTEPTNNYGGKIKIDSSLVKGGTGYKGSSYKNAIDGDYSTFYDGDKGQYVQIQLDKEYEISAIGYMPRGSEGWALERMTGGVFEGSSDGENWTTIYTVSDPQYIDARTSVKILSENFESADNHFSYIRYSVPSEQYCNIAEIELYSTEIEPEPTEAPEPTKAPNDEFVFYDDFQTYTADKSIVEKEGWKIGGSDSSRSLKKRIDSLSNISFAEFSRASNGNSAFAYNSFAPISDTVIYEFDFRMTRGNGAIGLQKSGNVSSHWQYTTGIYFNTSDNTISAVTTDRAHETLITNAYKSKWYHIKMEIDTNTKKVNFYTYDGNKALGYANGIALMDDTALDIGNIFMMLEANSGCDISDITVKTDASKTINDDYAVNTVDDSGKTPEALVYSDNFDEYNDNAVVDWSTSGSDSSKNMVKLSDGDVSFAKAQRGSGNSRGYFKPISINTTAIAEFKVRASEGNGIVLGFTSDTSNVHQMAWNPMSANVITAIGINNGVVSIIKDGVHTSETVPNADGWYTVKYTIDTVSKLYNVIVLDENNEELISLNAQPFVTDGATDIKSFAIGLNERNTGVDITDIKVIENSGVRILPGFFSDVNDETTVYRSDIEYMYENGYLEPLNYGDSFEPSISAKNSEFATIISEVICKLKGQAYSGDKDYVQTLKDLGIVAENIDINSELTRELAADIVWKAYQYKTNAKSNKNSLEACIDTALIQNGESLVNRDEMCNIANNLRKAIEKSNRTNALATDITGLNKAPEHKLSLWYNTPAWSANQDDFKMFQQFALPIGNGYMGATVYGAPQMEKIQFNDDTFFSGEYYDRATLDEEIGRTDREEKYNEIVNNLKQAKTWNDSFVTTARSIGDKGYLADTDLTGDACYLTMGNLYIEHTDMEKGAQITNYRRSLDIEDAIATVQFRYNNTDYTREFFADYPDNIIAVKLSASDSSKLNLAIRLEEAHQKNLSINSTDSLITMRGKADKGQMEYETQVKVDAKNGTQRSGGDRIYIENADEVVIYLKTGTDYDMNNIPEFKRDMSVVHKEITDGINAAIEKGYNALKENHLADYRPIFNRTSLSLGDNITNDIPTDELRATYKNTNNKMLEELFFQYGRYMLIASSRNGSLPANLQGVWNNSNSPSWGSGYTVNVNLQMNYWIAGAGNLKETIEPFIKYMSLLSKTGQETAKIYYGIDNGGWVCHNGTDVFGYTGPRKEIRYGLSPGSSAWLCQNLWDFYEFTQDEEILKEIYPIIKGNVLFMKEWLVEKDGKYVTGPSISPEQGPMLLGTKYDMQLVYELFTNFLKSAELMNETDTELINDVEYKKANMKSPWEIGTSQNGQLMEWDMDIDGDMYERGFQSDGTPHRHVSHLMALFPTAQINKNTPALMNAAKRTLNLRGDEATGWSRAYKTIFWARAIGDDGSGTNTRSADRAYKIFQGQLNDSTYANLFDTHPPFQADGNYGASAAICEFLVQSGTGDIDILPSLPTAWKEKGEVSGIATRGGFNLDIAWEHGKATKINVLSTAGNQCILSYPYFTSDVKIMSNGAEVETTRNGNKLIFNTEKNKTYYVDFGNGDLYDYEINDITLDKDTINSSNTVNEVVVTKRAETDELNGSLIIAVYDNNGIIKATKAVDMDMSNLLIDTPTAITVNLELPEGISDNCCIKVFLWNDIKQMKPLAVSYLKK